MSIHELESTVRELQELHRMKKELESEISALEDATKSEMGDREQLQSVLTVSIGRRLSPADSIPRR